MVILIFFFSENFEKKKNQSKCQTVWIQIRPNIQMVVLKDFFFEKVSRWQKIKVSNSLDPDKAQQIVRPDLDLTERIFRKRWFCKKSADSKKENHEKLLGMQKIKFCL